MQDKNLFRNGIVRNWQVAIWLLLFLSTAWGNTQDRKLAKKFSPILILVLSLS